LAGRATETPGDLHATASAHVATTASNASRESGIERAFSTWPVSAESGYGVTMGRHVHLTLWVVALAFVSLAAVFGTLAVDQTAVGRTEAQHLGFGYPLHFAWADETRWYGDGKQVDVPEIQTFTLNPWEDTTDVDGSALLISWFVVYAVALALWLLIRWLLPRFTLDRRAATTS
jgi:hypothetical protein